MKKKIIGILILVLIITVGVISYISFRDKKDSDLTKIKLSEVTHSAFYAPLYVAMENGYFKEEGIDIDLILTSGADKVAAAVLSNDVQIGFAGPESAIYVYNGGEEDYLVTFAGLTKKDGQFIVGRKEEKDFKLENLIGKEVLAGRKGGMPELNFLNALKNANINKKEVNENTSVDFASLSGSFIAGTGDYVNLFEPNASKLVSEGYGYIVGNIGSLSGEVPYTAFYTRKSYLENNKELLEKFTKALNKGIQFVSENNEEEIAKVIQPQFKDLSLNELTSIVKNYRDYDSWLSTPFINENIFKNLEDIMKDNSLLEDYVPYDKLINNLYHE